MDQDIRSTLLHWVASVFIAPISAIMSNNSTYAVAPFDHAKADVILRSSDNIDFRVFKLFLSLASPFFETLFDIPQPAQSSEDQEIKDGLVVIPVAEDSKTLNALLCFCYPSTLVDDPELELLEDVVNVLQAAKKYSLDVIEKKVAHTFSSPKIVEVEPLRCFAMARHRGMQEETIIAAKHTLTQPLIPSWFEEIELINASDLLSLLTYHKRCGDAVYALSLDLSWIKSHYGSAGACSWLSGQQENSAMPPLPRAFGAGPSRPPDVGCGCPGTNTSKHTLFSNRPLHWWEDFMAKTFTELRDKPCRATVRVFAEKTVQAVKARNCQVCSPKVTEGMRDFLDLFVRKIEEAVSEIELELKF